MIVSLFLLGILLPWLAGANNIGGFKGCTAPQKKQIQDAYADALRMVRRADPFLRSCARGIGGEYACKDYDPGVLEKRFFGTDDTFYSNVFSRAHWWQPWWLDWLFGKNIDVNCVDIENKSKNTCKSLGPFAGGYAVSERGPQIVFCPILFRSCSLVDGGSPGNPSDPDGETYAQLACSLDQTKAYLDIQSDDTKHNQGWYENRGRVFFHEMVHLAVISNTDTADNYAQYVSSLWFSQFYGLPSSSLITKPANIAAPEEPNDDVLESTDVGTGPIGGGDPDYDLTQSMEADAFSAGDYVSGNDLNSQGGDPGGSWLQNKKLRILALGDTAPQRLNSLIDQLQKACPDATIIVARIIQSRNAATAARITTYNDAIAALVTTRAKSGQHVFMVDMPAAVSADASDMADDLHPNDQGYSQMAIMWAIGLTRANALGWIKDPLPPDSSTHNVPCSHNPGWISQGQIANGAGFGDSLFLTIICPDINGQCSCQPVDNLKNNSVAVTSQDIDNPSGCDAQSLTYPLSPAIRFADLNGDGRAEYLHVDADGEVTAYLNLGGPDNGPNAAKVAWLPQGKIATGVGATRDSEMEELSISDLNGDGRAEYLYVNEDSSVEAYLNLGGPDDGPNAAKVGWRDGRADYCSIDRKTGAMSVWLNAGGPDDGPHAAQVVWLPQGQIASGVGDHGYGIQLADLNGDGRAEYLDVDLDTSAVNAWLSGC
ncbi:hypothetical protein PRZ48_007122 [Zasmidium cellare]|uniref:SGNH hydrolase-type esterase domain-containing protein n=1 Tax=Zasmidium cellare TaxID=395010 RepID=A0ABR0EIW1_ZASCE|nr:hypothetical protein PRZ48_007122 [Zasmidium cellare]